MTQRTFILQYISVCVSVKLVGSGRVDIFQKLIRVTVSKLTVLSVVFPESYLNYTLCFIICTLSVNSV